MFLIRNQLSQIQTQMVFVVGIVIVVWMSLECEPCSLSILYEESSGNSGNIIPHKLLFFYTEWCGYCKQFKPEWEQIKRQFNQSSFVELIEINGDTQKELVQSYNVPGFPTLIMETSSGEVIPFSGERNSNSVIEFVNQFQ